MVKLFSIWVTEDGYSFAHTCKDSNIRDCLKGKSDDDKSRAIKLVSDELDKIKSHFIEHVHRS